MIAIAHLNAGSAVITVGIHTMPTFQVPDCAAFTLPETGRVLFDTLTLLVPVTLMLPLTGTGFAVAFTTVTGADGGV
jgi:hypothetical protein